MTWNIDLQKLFHCSQSTAGLGKERNILILPLFHSASNDLKRGHFLRKRFAFDTQKFICWWTQEGCGSDRQLGLSSLCRALQKSVHFNCMCRHPSLKLWRFANAIIVPQAVWCCWPKTLSSFYHCTHSISGMHTMKKGGQLCPCPCCGCLASYAGSCC